MHTRSTTLLVPKPAKAQSQTTCRFLGPRFVAFVEGFSPSYAPIRSLMCPGLQMRPRFSLLADPRTRRDRQATTRRPLQSLWQAWFFSHFWQSLTVSGLRSARPSLGSPSKNAALGLYSVTSDHSGMELPRSALWYARRAYRPLARPARLVLLRDELGIGQYCLKHCNVPAPSLLPHPYTLIPNSICSTPPVVSLPQRVSSPHSSSRVRCRRWASNVER